MRLLSVTAATLLALVSASAGAVPAIAAEPIVVGSCATSVQGTPGTPVSLSPNAVLQPVTDLVRAVPLLGPPLAEPFKQAFSQLPPIPIGAVQTGTTTISGGTIANAVAAQLQKISLLGPILAAFVLTLVKTILIIKGVDQNYAQVIQGVLIVGVVMIGGLAIRQKGKTGA